MTTALVFSSTDPGVVRPDNEDCVVVLHRTAAHSTALERAIAVDLSDGPLLVAVADGMGGVNAGEVASALAVEALRERFGEPFAEASEADYLRAAFEHAHERVCAASTARPEHGGMGATLGSAPAYSKETVVSPSRPPPFFATTESGRSVNPQRRVAAHA